MYYRTILITTFLFLLEIYFCLSDKPCGGYDIKVTPIKNCPEPKNQNIKIQNLTITVTDECKVIPRGCFKVMKDIKAAEVEYYFNKSPIKKKGTENFCEILSNPDTQKTLQTYKSAPKKCPVSAGQYCFNKGSTVIEELDSKTLSFLVGTTTGYFSVNSQGSSDKGCVEFKMTVTKKG